MSAYYRHRCYAFEPDLNLGDEAAKEDILKVLAYWLELDLAGFRFDAANHLLEGPDLEVPDLPAQHRLLREMSRFMRSLLGDAIFLGRLSREDWQRVYQVFALDKRMRIYGRGIRRRLAPMLGGDRRWIEPAYSLLLTMPGTPVIIHGDEIGMGEDLALQERWSVRTPMQWWIGCGVPQLFPGFPLPTY